MSLRSWIPIEKLNWECLSRNERVSASLLKQHIGKIRWDLLSENNNPNIIPLLEENIDKVDWEALSFNPSAVLLLEQNMDKVDSFDWFSLSCNPNTISILEKNPDKIDWSGLSVNPNAIHLLEQNLDKIDWSNLSNNPNAILLLEQNLDKVNWVQLSYNPNAMAIIEQNLDKVNWVELSCCSNAIPILMKNQDKIHWCVLCRNPNAIPLLQQNFDKIDWYQLSYNPNAISILEVDERLKGYISQDKDSQRYDEKEFIGEDEVLKLQTEQNNKCHYCWRGFNKDTKWTLDRINNSIGHNTGNCVLCCENCNKRRSDQHYKTFYRKEALRRYSYKHPMVYLIDEENKDVFYELKNSICGGPSIVFHRYAEADKTRIKRPIYENGEWLEGKEGKMVRKVVGYDCNALYLNCIGQNIPCGVLKWSVYTGNQSKEDIDMFIRNFNRISCGFIEVDIHTLEELMNKFGEFPLIFKNMEYDANEVIGEDMRKIYNNYDEMSDKDKLSYDGSKKLMTRKLISSFKGEKVLIKSDRLCWLLDQGLVVTKIHGFIRGQKGRIFEKFVEKVSDERRKGDISPNYAIIADMWKLVGNSAFGRTGMNKNKFHKIQYGNEKMYNKKVGSCLFKDANQYGKVFEISSDFHRTKQNIPIQIACSIYDDAKFKMSQFYYDCVDKYLDRSDYQYIQMDTDSAYIAFTGDFEDLIKPEMKEEYLRDKNNWFLREDTDENKAFDRRKAGLFKPEFEGAGIVALGSKTYFVKGFGDKHKYSCKGIQKKNNCSEICFNNYLQVLLGERKSRIINKGIRILKKKQIEGSGSTTLNENRQVYMYSVEKVGLTAKYDKRCVMNDKISTVPLNI